MNKTNISNKIRLIIFCALLGAFSAAVLWLFLYLVHIGTELIWGIIPEKENAPSCYLVIACTAGGLIIGLFRKRFGDYLESMQTVMGTVKKPVHIHMAKYQCFWLPHCCR